ncbi:unnamed protein product [Coccothraustes coccothraustes]
MPRALRVLAGNTARGSERGSRQCPVRWRDRPGGLRAGRDGPPPPAEPSPPGQKGSGERVRASAKLPAGLACPSALTLTSKLPLPSRAGSFPGTARRVPGKPPSLRGSGHGQLHPGCEPPRDGGGALRREAPCPPRRGHACGVRRVLSGSARARLSLGRAAGRRPPCPRPPGSGVCAAPGRWRSLVGARAALPGEGIPHGPASWTAGKRAGSSCAPDK